VNSLEALLRSLSESKPGPRKLEQAEQAWNILVQVLLPLVIILTFVIITTVAAYKSAYDTMEDVLDKTGPLPTLQLYDKIVELQLQRLLRELERVKDEERKALGIVVFPTPERVQRVGSRVEDRDFKQLCRLTGQHLSSPLSLEYFRYASNLYSRVLKGAHVRDPSGFAVRRRDEHAVSIDRMLAVEERRRAADGWITSKHRRIIQGQILDFLEGLAREVVTIQTGLVRLIFEEISDSNNPTLFSDEPISPPPGIADLTMSHEERTRLATQFYGEVVDHLRRRLDGDGYRLLPATWQQLRN